MKTKSILLVVALLSFTMFSFSCSNDDEGGDGGGGAGAGTIVAKVDGANFTSAQALTAASQSNGMLIVTGSTLSTPTKTITLNMSEFDGVGTYAVGGGANVANVVVYSEVNPANPQDVITWQAPYDESQAGEIVITEVTSTLVKGTFHFKVKNIAGDNSEKNITEGSFNVNFTTLP